MMIDFIKENIIQIIFILLIIYILLCYLDIIDHPTSLQDTLWTHCKKSFAERVWGSNNTIYGAFMKERPFELEEVRIVDIANLAGKEMSQNKSFPKLGQNDRMLFYLDVMDRYHKAQGKIPPKTLVIYVIKNYKNLRGSHTIAPPISKRIWKRLNKIVKNPQVRVAVAEDYTNFPKTKWTNKKYHYLRARDDYLCFYIAQNYKKKYTKAIVVSNDKFRDFRDFDKIPPFMATYIWKDSNGRIRTLKEKINTQRKRLGQYRDYHTEEFDVDLYE